MVYQTLPQTLLQITPLYISTKEFGSLWSLPLQSPHTGDTGNGIILAGLPGINQSGQFVELKYTCVCVVRTTYIGGIEGEYECCTYVRTY